MNDTSPEIEKLQFEMMKRLGAERRIELACEMYMAARASAIASLPPGLSETARRREFIGTMYGTEFCDRFFEDEK